MIDYSQIFSGSDNFFKYIYTTGIVLVVLSVVYPLQKKDALELQIVDFYKTGELLKLEIDELNEEISFSRNQILKTRSNILELKKANEIDENRDSLKIYLDKIEVSLVKLNEDLKLAAIQNIELQFEKQKISVLESQSNGYDKYFNLLFYFGTVITLIGFLCWGYPQIKLFYTENFKNIQNYNSSKEDDNDHNDGNNAANTAPPSTG